MFLKILKKIFFTFLIYFAASCAAELLFSIPACAYYDEVLLEEHFRIAKVKFRHWHTSGSGLFRISFFTPSDWWDPPTDDILTGSTLDYQKMDTVLNILSVELRLLRGFSVDAEYGDNGFSGGKGLDHDWLHAPGKILYFFNGDIWENPLHRDFSLSSSKLSGSTRIYSVNAYLRVYNNSRRRSKSDSEPEQNLDLYVGYSWYEDMIRMTDGYQILSTDIIILTPPVGPFSGLNSTYEMRWRGLRFGLRDTIKISSKFSLQGRFAYAPYISYRGEGCWNLRTDLAKPSFLHIAQGRIIEFFTSIEWNFWKRLQLEAGYMYIFYHAKNGIDRTFFSDGTQSEVTLEKVKSTRKGMFLAISLK